jgi:hypothetical protein
MQSACAFDRDVLWHGISVITLQDVSDLVT